MRWATATSRRRPAVSTRSTWTTEASSGSALAGVRSAGDLEFVKGELWLSTLDNKLVHIDTKTGEVIEEFSHGIANLCGLSLTADGFLGYARNSIYRIDLSGEKLTKIGEIDGIEFALGADSLPTDYYLSPTG